MNFSKLNFGKKLISSLELIPTHRSRTFKAIISVTRWFGLFLNI